MSCTHPFNQVEASKPAETTGRVGDIASHRLHLKCATCGESLLLQWLTYGEFVASQVTGVNLPYTGHPRYAKK